MYLAGYLSKSPLSQDGQLWRGSRKAAPRIRNPMHLLRRSRSEQGQTLVEFALAIMLFLFLVFAVIDFGHLFFVEMDAQNALQEAARYGSTGNHLPDPANPDNYLSRVASITHLLQNDLSGEQFSDIQISSATGGSGSAGGPGDMLTISATVHMPLLTPLIAQMFPNGQYTFTSSITVKNEPFQANLTN